MPNNALRSRKRYDTWERDFRPIKNPHNANAGLDGYGFETYGAELEQVLDVVRTERKRVWTVVEGDNGKWYIGNGYQLVNRVMYVITEVPCDRPELNVCYG